MIGERTRHALAADKARGIKLGNPKQARINRAKAAEQAQALRPHIERCIKDARGIVAPNGDQWFPMQVRRVRDRLGL
jgi:DNA invertase Pin-like site-specific DNA recombinase